MKKIIKIIILIIILIVLIFIGYFFVGKAKSVDKVEWGVTFSKRYAIDLGLDWQETFLGILDDLKVKKIRLIAYWDEIEKEEGEYDFIDLDWQVDEIEKRGGEIILAVGRRMPRWPECFEPGWIKSAKGGLPLDEAKKQERVLAFIEQTINRYKKYDSIKIWQIENEPFFSAFGDCPNFDKKFLEKEISLAKDLDNRPIMITESGEFSTWIGGARRADILGTSLYRKIYGKLGFYFTYPISPVFYQRKSALIKLFFDIDEIIAIEVQAEPWGHKPMQEMTADEQDISMSFEQFEGVLEYTQNAGFEKAYLWGVEWWYWRLKEFQDDRFWEHAKTLF